MKFIIVACSIALLIGCADPGTSAEPMAAESDESTNKLVGEKTQRVETGDVHWLRDPEQAKRLAKQTGKPILMLFQEIPG